MNRKSLIIKLIIFILALSLTYKASVEPSPLNKGPESAILSKTPIYSKSIKEGKEVGQSAVVVRVIDGDTIIVQLKDKKDTVRLIGIDTPEIVDPRKPVQCFGKEASEKAKEILNGSLIYLESDPTQGERDRYQRLLRYVFLKNGTNFNQLMVNEGFAHEYTYKSNPYKYQKEFIQAEKGAREGRRGLWGALICSGRGKEDRR